MSSSNSWYDQYGIDLNPYTKLKQTSSESKLVKRLGKVLGELERSECKIRELQSEVDNLRMWVRPNTMNIVSCVYCNRNYHHNGNNMPAFLLKHMEDCPKHPLRNMINRLATLIEVTESVVQLIPIQSFSSYGYNRVYHDVGLAIDAARDALSPYRTAKPEPDVDLEPIEETRILDLE